MEKKFYQSEYENLSGECKREIEEMQNNCDRMVKAKDQMYRELQERVRQKYMENQNVFRELNEEIDRLKFNCLELARDKQSKIEQIKEIEEKREREARFFPIRISRSCYYRLRTLKRRLSIKRRLSKLVS